MECLTNTFNTGGKPFKPISQSVFQIPESWENIFKIFKMIFTKFLHFYIAVDSNINVNIIRDGVMKKQPILWEKYYLFFYKETVHNCLFIRL